MTTDENIKRVQQAARDHMYEVGEYPLDDAGCGMYNLEVSNDKLPMVKTKYDVVIQCYPNNEYNGVFLLAYYDVDNGFVDYDVYNLDDFSEAEQEQIVQAYLEALNA